MAWLLVHIDDHKTVEQEITSVMDGLRESADLQFRLAHPAGNFSRLTCVFRALPLASGRSIFALTLKSGRDQSLQP